MNRRRASSRRNPTPTPTPYASTIRALGATAHWAGRYNRFDDGSSAWWVDTISGHALSASGAARPSIALFGGWTFSGAQYLSGDIALAALLDDSAVYTLYTVHKASVSITAGDAVVCWAGAAQHVFHGVSGTYNSAFVSRTDGSGTTTGTGAVAPANDYVVDSHVYTGSACSTWENGGPSLVASANTRAPASCSRFTIGARRLSGGAVDKQWDGDICEVIVFVGVQHTAAQRMAIERLIAAQYDWPVLQGVTGFSASNYLKSAAGQGVIGSAVTGVWIDALIRADAVPAGTQYIAACTQSSGLKGYGHLFGADAETFIRNGTTTVFSPTRTPVAADVGRLTLFGGGHDLTTVRAYWNGVEIGAGSAIAGYLVPDGSILMGIGNQNGAGTNPATSFSIFGVAGGNVANSTANQAARAAAIKANRRFIATAGSTPTHGWRFEDVAASYSDLVGSDVQSMTGTLTATQAIVTAWPW